MKKNYRVVITQIIYRGTHEPLIKEHTLSWHRFWVVAWLVAFKQNLNYKNTSTARVRKLFNSEKSNENKAV